MLKDKLRVLVSCLFFFEVYLKIVVIDKGQYFLWISETFLLRSGVWQKDKR